MSLLSDGLVRIGALLFRRRQEEELDEELRFHIEREAEERRRLGAPADAAQREAVRAFGGMARYKEEAREARGVRPLEDLAADIRYALRGLRRNPGFTAAALTVLGLGIGAGTAMFSIVDSVLLADLPYPDAGRLVRIYEKNSPTNIWSLSVVDVQAIRDQQKSFDAFGALRIGSAGLSGGGAPEQVAVGRASAGFFRTLGVSAAVGRLIEPGDEPPGAPPVVVLSDASARSRFGGATAALGRPLSIDGVSHSVIGVLRPGVDRLAGLRIQVWPVLQLHAPDRRGPFGWRGIARLKPGVSLESAARDLAGISERIFPLWASGFRDREARLTPVPLRDTIIGTADRQVGLFAAAVALILLIAIVNVATLMLVRASARQQEVAVRVALGAGRGRLARLLVTESLVLTVLAGAVGVAVAAAGVSLAPRIAPSIPRIDEAALNGRAAGFAMLTAMLSGMLVSLAPLAATLARGRLGNLRVDARRIGAGRRTGLLQSGFVVAEFALALPLLLGAGLLTASFVRLEQLNPGFDPAGVTGAELTLPPARYPDFDAVQRFFRQAESRMSEAPGAVAVGLSTSLPPDDAGGDTNNFDLLDRPVREGSAEPTSPWSAVTSGYFRALGIPLLAGRLFAAADSAAAPPVLLVSRSWERHYYPGASALGRRLFSGGCRSCPPSTIVGVVGDVKYLGLAGLGESVYEPLSQSGARGVNLIVRSGASPASTARTMLEVVRGLDPELPVVQQRLEDVLRASLADPFRWTAMLTGFAAIALGLAAVGIFGLMSYAVRQRRREIGLRMALGAEPARVTRMIVGKGMRYAGLGLVLGLGLSVLGTRWLQSLLFQVTPANPAVLVAAGSILLLTAFLACWLPGRRAARIPAVEAINSE